MENRGRHFSSISEILGESTSKLRIADKMKRYSLWDRWPEIVGREVAEHARPARWQGNILVVRVEHPTWVQELGFLKHEMIERLKESLKNAPIKDIRFEVGPLPQAPDSAVVDRSIEERKLSSDEEEFVEQVSGEIADPEIREAAQRAMARSFARKR